MQETNPVGRPTVLTPEAIRKLTEAFALGCTDLEACYYADISKSTLYDYQKENPEFLELKEKLKERPILQARQSVIKAMVDDGDLALKFLERKKKDEFSLRQELAGVKGQPLVDLDNPQILRTLLLTAQSAEEAYRKKQDETADPDPTPPKST